MKQTGMLTLTATKNLEVLKMLAKVWNISQSSSTWGLTVA